MLRAIWRAAGLDRAAEARRRAEDLEEFEYHMELLRRAERDAGLCADAAHRRAAERFGDPRRHLAACTPQTLGGLLVKVNLSLTWHVVLTIGLIGTFAYAWTATQRVAELRAALNAAEGDARAQQAPEAVQRAVLASIWGETSGEIEVCGAVKSPGKFATSLDKPLDVAALIEMAGGAADGARGVQMNRAEENWGAYVRIKDAQKNRGNTNLMPEPGSKLTVQ